MGQKFAIARFNAYSDAGGYEPNKHHYEITVIVKPDTQISVKLHSPQSYTREGKNSKWFNGVTLVVNDRAYELVDNYNETMGKIESALNLVL